MKVTLLAGGGALYIYPNIHENTRAAGLLAHQKMVIDVMYPGDETLVITVDEARLPQVTQDLATKYGVAIVDTRE